MTTIRIAVCALFLAMLPPVGAQSLPPAEQVVARLRLANDWFMRKYTDPGREIVTDRHRPSNIWTRGVYYEGLMSLYRIDADPRYLAYAQAWGDAHKWGLRTGPRTRSADDQCCGQTYLDLFQLDPRPERLAAIKSSVDSMIASPRRDDWTWIDAIQMSMPVYAKLGVITGDRNYYVHMHEWYARTRDGGDGKRGLYDAPSGLWFRDASFLPPYAEPNGAHCFWSRGNGWVMAALVRVLDTIPGDAPFRAEYVSMLQSMSAAVKAVQRQDGFWNVSLLDPSHFGGRETSGTALFTYALARGIDLKIVSKDEYMPVVARAWDALSRQAVHDDGFLGFVQGTGKQPSDGQPVAFDSHPDFEDYGVGCFLLAGSAVNRLAAEPRR